MINTENFIARDRDEYKLKTLVMKELNEFIKEHKIERSNILEFRTNTTYFEKGCCFEVTISWWE